MATLAGAARTLVGCACRRSASLGFFQGEESKLRSARLGRDAPRERGFLFAILFPIGEEAIPSWRKKGPNRMLLNKRYTPQQQQARKAAVHAAVMKLYCDVLEIWSVCPYKRCRRARQCVGDSNKCLKQRWWDEVPESLRDWVKAEVVAGGPRRVPPATSDERVARSAISF